jgi:hypothetical protein
MDGGINYTMRAGEDVKRHETKMNSINQALSGIEDCSRSRYNNILTVLLKMKMKYTQSRASDRS